MTTREATAAYEAPPGEDLQLPGPLANYRFDISKLKTLALDLPANLPFADWVALGADLAHADRAIGWLIGDWWRFGERAYGVRKGIVDSPDWQGPAFQTCRNAGSVAKAFETSRRRDVLSYKHHAEVAALEPPVADALLDRAETEGLSARDLRGEVRRLRTAQRIGDLVAQPLPADAPVHILLVDPPWRYENPPMGDGGRSVENHYPTMSLDELQALDIGACALPDAVLFMWATAPQAFEAMKLMEAWGFEYRTFGTWDKVHAGLGYYWRNQQEILLLGRRGEIPPPDPSLRPPSVYREARGEHSAKPAHYAELIESWYPSLRKREFFARGGARPGWEPSWGNQAVGDAA